MALVEIPLGTSRTHGSSTADALDIASWSTTSTTTTFPPPVPPLPLDLIATTEGDKDAVRVKKRQARKSLPANSDLVNKAPAILDRRKSSRPKSIFIERVSSGGTSSVRSAKGLGPRFPVVVDTVPALVSEFNWIQSPTLLPSPVSMDTPASPVEAATSESFEDAPEKSSEDTTGKSNAEEATKENEEAHTSLPPSDSEQSQEKEQSAGEDATSTNVIHSRTNSISDAPVMPPPENARSRSVSPSKRPTTSDGQSPDHSRRPSVISTSALQSASRSGSRSPTRMPIRAQSPPKLYRGLSGDPAQRQTATSPQPPPMNRSTSKGFGGFLSRMGSIRKPAKSPPASGQERTIFDRRNTSQSISSLASNGEHLPTIEDGVEGVHGVKRPSLQAQFLTLRKHGQDLVERNGHPVNADEETEAESLASPPASSYQDASSLPVPPLTPALKSPLPDPNLPPGTASGLTAGPAEEPRPVDWDLWQAVVYEGPAAVARTSGEELTRAIASGIPAAIRGVVWQVLADSKSPELEELYTTLRNRSVADIESEQPPSRPATVTREDSQVLFQNGENGEKESEVASSRSSIRSDKSAPTTPPKGSKTSPPSSILADDAESRANILAEKNKREAASLSKLEKAIKRDLGSRTSFSKYTQAAGLQDGLFGLCKAYALFDEGVGYAQGINFIAMPLLFNATEEEAFTLLVRLMSKYDVRNMFTGDMAGLHLRLYQFERLLEDHDPALYCHLRRRNVAPALYATQWFLTLFAYRFPLQLVLRVYDLIFSQGLIAILKFGLVLLERNRDALLDMQDMGQLTNFLKEKLFDVYIDKSPSASSLLEGGFFGSVSGGADKELYRADELVRDACAVEISESTLASYTTEWEELQRKDAEVEQVRGSNIALTARVKALEDRTQQQDAEHVTIAGEVVRIKVENDKLQDENEGLKIKIEELQRMVDTQPAEIEAKFREEMERVLQRNSEVQSENRVLKEEQEEMERQLVDTKMKHAETQSSHDALSRRWATVQAMFNDK